MPAARSRTENPVVRSPVPPRQISKPASTLVSHQPGRISRCRLASAMNGPMLSRRTPVPPPTRLNLR